MRWTLSFARRLLSGGAPPSLRSRQLGITHPTFYRHYSDLINEYFQPRATRSPLPVEPTSRNVEHDTTERRLRREIADLRKTVSLYGEAIRQLALENHALRTQLDQAGNITSLRPITAQPVQHH